MTIRRTDAVEIRAGHHGPRVHRELALRDCDHARHRVAFRPRDRPLISSRDHTRSEPPANIAGVILKFDES